MQRTLSVIVLLALVCGSLGHAILRTPTPWNNAPSKSAPCGGGTAPTAAPNSLIIGADNTISWQVIAGDGTGPITVYITNSTDPNVFNTRTNVVNLGTFESPSVGSVSPTIRIPQMGCPAGRGCMIQVASTSAWYSCSNVELLPAGTPIPPKPRGCITASGFTQHCTFLNNRRISVNVGVTTTQLPTMELTSAVSFYESVINNKNVILNGEERRCQDALKAYSCQNAFPACDQTQVCKFWCQNLANNCNINATHANLFDCTNAPDTCSPASAFQPLSLIALLAMAFVYMVAF